MLCLKKMRLCEISKRMSTRIWYISLYKRIHLRYFLALLQQKRYCSQWISEFHFISTIKPQTGWSRSLLISQYTALYKIVLYIYCMHIKCYLPIYFFSLLHMLRYNWIYILYLPMLLYNWIYSLYLPMLL